MKLLSPVRPHQGLLVFFSVLFLTHAGVAQEWSTGYFNTNSGWKRNDALAYETNTGGLSETGQNYGNSFPQQWFTDDPFNVTLSNGASSVLKYMSGFTLGFSSAGNNTVLFGGYAPTQIKPGISSPSVYRSFAPFVTSGSGTAVFSVDFSIIASSPSSFTNRDSFGFSLLSGGSALIADFSLAPTTNTSLLNVSYNAGAAVGAIAYGSLYRITAALQGTNISAVLHGLSTQTNLSGVVTNYVTNSAVSIVDGGLIAGGLTAENFDRVGLNWDLASGNPADFGSNYMMVNTMSVVPEPSVVHLLGATFLLAVGWKMRSRC